MDGEGGVRLEGSAGRTPTRHPPEETGLSSYAAAPTLAVPRIGFKRPRLDRDRFMRITRDWWVECKKILQRACPLIIVPSPVRETLGVA
jgi:hypothetical protein